MTLPGRADLFRILAGQGPEAFEHAAAQLGFVFAPRTPSRREPGDDKAEDAGVEVIREEAEVPTIGLPTSSLSMVRLVAAAYDDAEPQPLDDLGFERLSDAQWASEGAHRTRSAPLVPIIESWSSLGPRLLEGLASLSAHRVDFDTLVDRIARGEPLGELPRRPRKSGPSKLWVFADRTLPNAPLWQDQLHVIHQLDAWLGGRTVAPHFVVGATPDWSVDLDGGLFDPNLVAEGELVLVLSDLGSYGVPDRSRAWRRWTRGLHRRGARVLGLVVAPVGGARPQPEEVETIAWARASPAVRAEDTDGCEALLTSMAFALAVEPGLLRWLRIGLSRSEVGPEHELAVWNHPAVTHEGLNICIREERLAEYRARFADLARPEQARAIAAQRAWRAHVAPEIWYQEVIHLALAGHTELVDDSLDEASEFFERLCGGIDALTPDRAALQARWMQSFADYAPREVAPLDSSLSTALSLLWVHAQGARATPQLCEPPGWVEPDAARRLGADQRPRDYHIYAQGDGLRLAAERAAELGSWVATMRARSPSLWANAGEAIPPWATEGGRDQFGRWARVEVAGVSFVMRWIEPGTFWMGSPEEEVGRVEREGPRHEVTLTEGFWLAEAPCTQALWTAVTGRNPSAFEGPTRPVERVSWDDVVAFIDAVNADCPGLELALPTEAQWEYACRAGTEGATYAGELEDEDRAPVLDGVAWYAGNSEQSTHPVKGKAPNPWGLYDMLGNVDEWCSDGSDGLWEPDAYESGPVADPEAPAGERPGRVVRGGSWDDHAGLCRAAYRLADHREDAVDDLGFRVARGRVPGGAKPAAPARATPAGPRGTSETEPRGAAHVHLGSSVRLPVDFSRAVELRTDLMSLTLEPLERPAWAHRLARDRFGLFVDVEVEPKQKSVLPASFRMRWLPPGRFWMGSPEKEVGHIDREGPRHLVTLTEGFWLADAPCTQGVWEAVLGKDANRSKFRSPERPVESVGWDTTQEFLQRMNEVQPGLHLRLPTEAQWEYACRVGTEGATYEGELEGTERAPILDRIAWYGGNSDKDSELENGQSTFLDVQNAGTHPVKGKDPNPWGLYDMLGNVDEWCSDGAEGWQADAYEAGPVVDPEAPAGERPFRVIRGGSWGALARYCRAADRSASHRERARDNLGFRVARGRAPEGQ